MGYVLHSSTVDTTFEPARYPDPSAKGGVTRAHHLRGYFPVSRSVCSVGMAELGVPAPAAIKTKTATTRKHLRRDQAAAKKARSSSLSTADSVKERQVRFYLIVALQ